MKKAMGYIQSLYSSYIMPLTTRIGIHQTFHSVYWHLLLHHHIGEKEIAINDTTANFHVTTEEEFRRFRALVNERSVIEDLLHEIDSADVVYDIGANVGIYTCFLARELSAENVIAFEPHPSNVAALEKNLRLNGERARVLDKALSDLSGTAEFAVKSQNPGEGEHSLSVHEEDDTIEVDLETGDNLIDSGEIPQPTVLKVDIEGAELRALHGLESALMSPACRLCYVEVHPDRLPEYNDSAEDVNHFLKSCGFTVSKLYDREGEYFIKAVK